MKIVAIIGTHSRESNTKFFIEQIAKHLKGKGNIDIYQLDENVKIMPCQGCCNCLISGICRLNDDMNILMEKILEAQLVIFASPVYMGNISGTMKLFLDRFLPWIHIFRLAGKRALIISTAAHYDLSACNYLSKIALHLGMEIIDEILILTYKFHNHTYIPNIETYIEKIIIEIEEYKSCYFYSSTPTQEIIFKNLKKTYGKTNEYTKLFHEYKYWRQHKLDICESYKNYIQSFYP